MVLVTRDGYKVMVNETTHVCCVQHRSLEVQRLFENTKLHCMTFENLFMGMKYKYNMAYHIPKIVNRIPTTVKPPLTNKTACEKSS